MSTALPDETSLQISRIIMPEFSAPLRIALCQRPGADTEETGRYDLAWKDLCVF